MSEAVAVVFVLVAIFAGLVLLGLAVFGWGNPFPQPLT